MLELLSEYNLIKEFTEKIDPVPENQVKREERSKIVRAHMSKKKQRAA